VREPEHVQGVGEKDESRGAGRCGPREGVSAQRAAARRGTEEGRKRRTSYKLSPRTRIDSTQVDRSSASSSSIPAKSKRFPRQSKGSGWWRSQQGRARTGWWALGPELVELLSEPSCCDGHAQRSVLRKLAERKAEQGGDDGKMGMRGRGTKGDGSRRREGETLVPVRSQLAFRLRPVPGPQPILPLDRTSISAMSSKAFPHDPQLSNAKFETYRLTSPTASTRAFDLPGAAVTQARVQHGRTTLSAREVGSRIRHDHLNACWGGWLGWVDEHWEIWAAKLGQDLEPQFASLGSLPAPLEKDDAPPSEYPSVWALSPTTYVCADGFGRLYPLLVQPGASLSAVHGPAFELTDGVSGELRPFKIEWVGGDRRLLISAVRRTRAADGGWGKEEGWDLLLVTFGDDWSDGLRDTDSSDGSTDEMASGSKPTSASVRTLDVLWSLQGPDAPYLAYGNSSRLLLASSEPYSSAGSESATASTDPASTSSAVGSSSSEAIHLPQHPFSWAQSSTSVTVSISLPPSTARALIHPTIGTKTLSVLVGEASSPQTSLEGFAKRAYWDSVRSNESFWEWDAECGVLTLELEKTNPQTRWPHLFLPSGTTPDYLDVPEELAPEARKAIAADLDRFTAGLDLPDSAPGGIASLMREEMDIDDEGDDEGLAADGEARVGRPVRWTFVDADGGGGRLLDRDAQLVARTLQGTEALIATALEWTQNGFAKLDDKLPSVLVKHSVSLRGATCRSPQDDTLTLSCLPRQLDALLFAPPPSPPTTTFTHAKTFPALAFVLSSKRQTKYILHSSLAPATVLAFSTPTTASSQGDLFVYRDAQGGTTAASGVVKLGGGDDGELLGVKGVKTGSGNVLVALCERRLVVVKDLV
jgi:hypothetical protein